MGSRGRIAAGGGVLWRTAEGAAEVALVHRPRYDDWSLPKGKAQDGEDELTAAVREVREETGALVAVSRRMPRVHYLDGERPKTVTFWAMRHVGGAFEPGDEVDQLVWLPAGAAAARCSYDTDRQVLAEFTALPAPEAVVALVRHGRAGRRRDWKGPDSGRPLDEVGQEQARHVARLLQHFAPDRVISASPTRCIQTVTPLAQQLNQTVWIDTDFDDECYEKDAQGSVDALLEAARLNRSTVVCSQGVTIPGLVERTGSGRQHSDTRKGAAWLLSFAGGGVVASDYYDAAPHGR